MEQVDAPALPCVQVFTMQPQGWSAEELGRFVTAHTKQPQTEQTPNTRASQSPNAFPNVMNTITTKKWIKLWVLFSVKIAPFASEAVCVHVASDTKIDFSTMPC